MNLLKRPTKKKAKKTKDPAAFPAYISPEFRAIYDRFKDATMVKWPGCFQSYQAARHIAAAGIPGAVVECGVWRGGVSAIMAQTLHEAGERERDIYLFDNFEGLPRPGQEDFKVYDPQSKAIDRYEEHQAAGEAWDGAGQPEVRATLANCDYPAQRFHLVAGDILQTVPAQAPDRIALLRLDTDWYDSTKHEMEHLFPRLVQGGVLVVDDYWYWDGARKAVDEYVEAQKLQIYLCADSHYHGVSAVKTKA